MLSLQTSQEGWHFQLLYLDMSEFLKTAHISILRKWVILMSYLQTKAIVRNI